MRESPYKLYSLKGTELAILLAAQKGESVHCFGIINGDETKEDYMYALDHMVKQGVVQANGEKIMINQPYRHMIDSMVAANVALTVRTSDDALNDYCLYPAGAEKALVLSMSSVRRGGVLMTELTYEELFDDYFPEGLLPDDRQDVAVTESVDCELFRPALKMLREDRTIDDVRLIIGVDAVNMRTLERKSMIVMDLPMGLYTVCYDGDDIMAEPYEQHVFKEGLKLMLNGEVFEDDNGNDPFCNA